ncbi:MAG: SprT-like family protein [Planctomycetota bacterium]
MNDRISHLHSLIQQRKFDGDRQKKIASEIRDHLIANSRHIKQPNFAQISDGDLGDLFQLTDELCFDGYVGRVCESVADLPLTFRLSTRMTKSGGTTTMFRTREANKNLLSFEIAIATTPLFGTFPNAGSNEQNETSAVGGVCCRNRVEALQRIMEHEMVHLCELLLTGDSSCAARPFKSIVYRFFGHTESNHQLLTPADIARKKLGIIPGDQVTFDFQGRSMKGTVNRITKRATVLVPDPRGTPYSDGERYATYYVPLRQLKKTG